VAGDLAGFYSAVVLVGDEELRVAASGRRYLRWRREWVVFAPVGARGLRGKAAANESPRFDHFDLSVAAVVIHSYSAEQVASLWHSEYRCRALPPGSAQEPQGPGAVRSNPKPLASSENFLLQILSVEGSRALRHVSLVETRRSKQAALRIGDQVGERERDDRVSNCAENSDRENNPQSRRESPRLPSPCRTE
jgi:hypothetical protein